MALSRCLQVLGAFFFPSRKTLFLQRLRSRLRHAWLLHFWLISALLLMPVPRLARADDEPDVFTQTGSESLVTVSLLASGGTTGMEPGTSRQVLVEVRQQSWEVWTGSPSGTTEIRNYQKVPWAAALTFSVVVGGGSVSPASGSTGPGGDGSATFTIGDEASTLTVDATYGEGSVASRSITFSAPVDPEIWTWHHNEVLLSASLIPSASTENVPDGETRQVQVHADYTTWSVYTSNRGNTETRNYSTSPADGAQIIWSASGGGSVAPDATSSPTNSSGDATATFTMGTGGSAVQADVTYATSTATYATLTFTPSGIEEWTLDHRTPYVLSSVALSANGTTTGLQAGAQRTVTAAVTCSSHEVWVSNLDNTENRNLITVPAAGEPVVFSFDNGGGSLSSSSATTGSGGNAVITFTMGGEGSCLRASAGVGTGLPPLASATIDFSPVAEVWNNIGTTSELTVSLTAGGPLIDIVPGIARQLTAAIVSSTWDVWVSNLNHTEYRFVGSDPANGISVGFTVEAGDGQLPIGNGTTDSTGLASLGFTMGTEAVTVRANMLDGDNVIGSTAIHLTPLVEWTHIRSETTISTTVTVGGSGTVLRPGITRAVAARVMFTNWQVWGDGHEHEDYRNVGSGAASGALVAFSVDQGGGVISNAAETADTDGYATATFTMGNQDSRVRVDASYTAAASVGTLNFTLDDWEFDHSGGSFLTVNLSLGAAQIIDDVEYPTIIADVSATTWDVYKKWDPNTSAYIFANHNTSAGPAGGASVVFSGGGSVFIAPEPIDTDVTGWAGRTFGYVPGTLGSITATASFSGMTATAIKILNTQSGGGGPGGGGGGGGGGNTLTITTTKLSDGAVTEPYSDPVSATGGTSPYIWSAIGLPPGLSMSEGGVISGTPTSPGTYPVSISVEDSAPDPSATATKTLTLTIKYVPPPEPQPQPQPDAQGEPQPPTPWVQGYIAQSVSTAATESPFVAVSQGTDPDLASLLVITAGNTTDSSVPVTIGMGNSDGDLHFAQTSVNVTPGIPTLVRVWGRATSSAKDATEIALSGSFTDEGATGFSAPAPAPAKKTGTKSVKLTAFEGIQLKFSGRFYAPVDTRDFNRRPNDGSGWPATVRGHIHSAVAAGTRVPPDDRPAYPGIIAQDTGDYTSRLVFREGDQGVVLRTWLARPGDIPKVTVDEVRSITPDTLITNDAVLNAELSVTSGAFFQIQADFTKDLLLRPGFAFYRNGTPVKLFSVSTTFDNSIERDGAVDLGITQAAALADLTAGLSSAQQFWLADWAKNNAKVGGLVGFAINYSVFSKIVCHYPESLAGQPGIPYPFFSAAEGPNKAHRDSAAAKALIGWQESHPEKIKVSMKFGGFYEWKLVGKVTNGILKTSTSP